jgi:hypothetical protein
VIDATLLSRQETCTPTDEYVGNRLPNQGLPERFLPETPPLLLPNLVRLELTENRLTGSLTSHIVEACKILANSVT